MNGDLVLTVLVGLAMVVGVAGTLLPVLPGLWLIWLAGLVFGVFGGFEAVGWWAMALLTILAIAGTAAAFVVPGRRTSAIGVSWWGQALAAAASAIGFFLVPVVGAALGFILGIVVVSLLRTRSIKGCDCRLVVDAQVDDARLRHPVRNRPHHDGGLDRLALRSLTSSSVVCCLLSALSPCYLPAS